MNHLAIFASLGVLMLSGCVGPTTTADQLYTQFAKVCPPGVLIRSRDVKYHGKVDTEAGSYHLVGYFYTWEVLSDNERGHGKLLVFDSSNDYIGCYEVYGHPEVTIQGTRVNLHFPKETEQNQDTHFDFSGGLPDSDENRFGFYFVPPEMSSLHHMTK